MFKTGIILNIFTAIVIGIDTCLFACISVSYKILVVCVGWNQAYFTSYTAVATNKIQHRIVN